MAHSWKVKNAILPAQEPKNPTKKGLKSHQVGLLTKIVATCGLHCNALATLPSFLCQTLTVKSMLNREEQIHPRSSRKNIGKVAKK